MNSEVSKRTIGYITAAFGLVAGLAWNDAIRSLIQVVFPTAQDGLVAKFVYALILTLVVVIVIINLTRLVDGQGGEKKK